MSYSVYKHTFPNGKVYIGITSKKPETRWNRGYGYLSKSKPNGKYGQPLMANAILKYDWDDIQHEILFSGLTRKEACQKEIELIKEYKSNNRKFGYNISNGGLTGNSRSLKNHTGEKYNLLTFIEPTNIVASNGSYKWRLKCDCGNYTICSPSEVISGQIKSCGCLKEKIKRTLESYIGCTYERLKCVGVNKNNNMLKLACECGNTIEVSKREWQTKVRKSCGCLFKELGIKTIEKAREKITEDVILKRNESIKYSLRKNSCVKPFICVETNKIYNTGYEVNDDFKKEVYPNIIKALKGKIKSAYGFHWKYIE